MGKKKRNKKKKNKPCKIDVQEENYKDAPHSFVFHRNIVGKNIRQLIRDTRHVMEPFTARKLQASKKNVLKDFVSVAGLLHVTHFIIYTKTETSINMKLCRLPRGPTLTFKVHDYCLSRDVISSLKKPSVEQVHFLHHPLLVMNNFTGEGAHIKLMATMFQNMFPSINIHKVKLNDVRRCVLVDYDAETKMIEFRHYIIRVVPVGMSRSVKKLIQPKLPNLGKYNDISEYMTRAGYSSESEAELDGPASEIILPQNLKTRGNLKSAKSAVRLTELGPRLTLQLVKIEEGVCEGQVMFHEFVHKTEEELKQTEAFRRKKRKLKEARKRQQEENVQKKAAAHEENKQRSLAGIQRKQEEEQEADSNVEEPETKAELSDDDDVEYYKKEVGQAPDPDSFIPGGMKRKYRDGFKDKFVKKRKMDIVRKSDGPNVKSRKAKPGDRKVKPGDRKAKFGDKKVKFGDKKSKFGDKKAKPGDKKSKPGDKKRSRKPQTPEEHKQKNIQTFMKQIKEKKKKKLKAKEKKIKKKRV